MKMQLTADSFRPSLC